MNSVCKAMKAASMANPNLPSTAARFHSTPFLSLKKRVYWPERSYRRGPPRPRYDFVFERFQVPITNELNYRFPRMNWNWDPDAKAEYSSKSSEQALRNTQKLDRSALGLHAAGPINLEDVKTAYRSCALKWHPDHHQHASSKAFAEEQFKKCNAAYRSLRDQLSSSS